MVTKKTVESWISDLEPQLRTLAQSLRQIILDADTTLSEAIKWGNPIYEKKGRVCYLAATKAYMALGFFNATSLTDSETRMEGTGKKMRHVKIRSPHDIQPDQFAAWVHEAVALNERALA